MKLNVLKEIEEGIVILKDAEFDSLCNVTTETDIACLSFVVNTEYLHKACKKKNITAIIVPYELKDEKELYECGKGIILSNNPKYVFYQLHNYLYSSENMDYIEERHNKNQIGSNSYIHKSAIIADENVKIGNNVIIQENVVIREGVEIGNNVKIMSGAIIGYDACLASKDLDGNFMPIISAGKVKIGNNVQIGAYSAVSRGLFPYEITEIKDYSLLGFGANISHNVHVGKNVLVLDQTLVSGNTIIEDEVHLSPQTVISNRLKIGGNAYVAIGSVVVNNVKKGLRVAGNYAIENSKFLLWHRNKLRVK